MQTLRVHTDRRHLETASGDRIYLIGDTAWELFHALNREEAAFYLRTRASQGYNMIQAVVLAELDGQRATVSPVSAPSQSIAQMFEDIWEHIKDVWVSFLSIFE